MILEGLVLLVFGGGLLALHVIGFLFVWILKSLFFHLIAKGFFGLTARVYYGLAAQVFPRLTAPEPIRVRVIFVPEHPTRDIGVVARRKGVRLFLHDLFRAADCNWSWAGPEGDRRPDGVYGPSPNFGNAEAVELAHLGCSNPDPEHILCLRELAHKLAGRHPLLSKSFLVYPDWHTPQSKIFKRCLTLRHLENVYTTCVGEDIGGGFAAEKLRFLGSKALDGNSCPLGDCPSSNEIFPSDEVIDALLTIPDHPAGEADNVMLKMLHLQTSYDKTELEICARRAAELTPSQASRLVVSRADEVAEPALRLMDLTRALDSGSVASIDMESLIRALAFVMANTMALAASLEILLRNMPSREAISTRAFHVSIGKRPYPDFALCDRPYASQLEVDKNELERQKVESLSAQITCSGVASRLYIVAVMLYAATLYEPGSREHAFHQAHLESELGSEYSEYFLKHSGGTERPPDGSPLIGFVKENVKFVFQTIWTWKEEAKKTAKNYEQVELAWASGRETVSTRYDWTT